MASFEYKCRRCGKIELNPHCSESMAKTEIINVVLGIKSKQTQAPEMIDTHCCNDGGQGVSDLQGFRIDNPSKGEDNDNTGESKKQ